MDPATAFPKFVFQECILKKLETPDLVKCFQVSKKWHSLIPTHLKKEMVLASRVTIGPAHWRRFGDIGKEVELPDNIKEEMQKDCPHFKGQKKYQSSLLVYIPKMINGKGLTISYFDELIRNQRFGNPSVGLAKNETFYYVYRRNQAIKTSYWAIFTKQNLPNSLGICFSKQKKLIKEKYDVPFVLEAVIAIVMFYIFSGNKQEFLFSKEIMRCKEVCSNEQISVGNFDRGSLLLSTLNRPKVGIAAVQRLQV